MDKTQGPVTLEGPAGIESLAFRSMHGSDRLGQPFRYELELLSDDPGLRAEQVLGQSMTVHLELGERGIRHFNGFVSDFAIAGSVGSYLVYRMTLQPWFWFLSKTA